MPPVLDIHYGAVRRAVDVIGEPLEAVAGQVQQQGNDADTVADQDVGSRQDADLVPQVDMPPLHLHGGLAARRLEQVHGNPGERGIALDLEPVVPGQISGLLWGEALVVPHRGGPQRLNQDRGGGIRPRHRACDHRIDATSGDMGGEEPGVGNSAFAEPAANATPLMDTKAIFFGFSMPDDIYPGSRICIHYIEIVP